MAQAQIIRIAAAAITNEKRQMLLVRKNGTDAFIQPGGKIDAGETAVSALCRELREELALDVEPDDCRFLGRFYAEAANEIGATVEADVFRVRCDQQATAQAEIAEFIWYPGDDEEPVVLAPLTRDRVIPASGI